MLRLAGSTDGGRARATSVECGLSSAHEKFDSNSSRLVTEILRGISLRSSLISSPTENDVGGDGGGDETLDRKEMYTSSYSFSAVATFPKR